MRSKRVPGHTPFLVYFDYNFIYGAIRPSARLDREIKLEELRITYETFMVYLREELQSLEIEVDGGAGKKSFRTPSMSTYIAARMVHRLFLVLALDPKQTRLPPTLDLRPGILPLSNRNQLPLHCARIVERLPASNFRVLTRALTFSTLALQYEHHMSRALLMSSQGATFFSEPIFIYYSIFFRVCSSVGRALVFNLMVAGSSPTIPKASN
ncbi:30S ribosomal protein S14 chloroplastic [Bienertia sinuspersici]